jgi:hypothetical protein
VYKPSSITPGFAAPPSPFSLSVAGNSRHQLTQNTRKTGPRQVHPTQRPAARRPPPLRNLPTCPRAPPRVPLLPRPGQLQARQLRRGPPLQRPSPRQGARQPPGRQPPPAHRRQGRQGGSHGCRHPQWCRYRRRSRGRLHPAQRQEEVGLLTRVCELSPSFARLPIVLYDFWSTCTYDNHRVSALGRTGRWDVCWNIN